MRHNGDRRPEDIQAEIERTRTDMDATLSAIERRLTPGELVDQGMDYLRHSGGTEFVRNLGDQAKHNPMPVALVGIGLAWLMASGRNTGASAYDEGSTYEGMSSAYEGAKSGMQSKYEGAKSSMRSTASGLRERASGAKERLSQTTHSLTESARSARERLSQARGSASRGYQRARGGYDTMMREQPLALGAIGLAIGAVLAAAAPRTRKEDELMGPARERLAEQAKEAGREQLDKAKQVAAKAKDAATEEAGRQGMAQPASSQQPSSSASSPRPQQPPATPFPRGG